MFQTNIRFLPVPQNILYHKLLHTNEIPISQICNNRILCTKLDGIMEFIDFSLLGLNYSKMNANIIRIGGAMAKIKGKTTIIIHSNIYIEIK